ncbi:MAG: L,D-transpeptidase family protein [Chitinophagaceae bacterium]|nr:L,D-transpeptidase family protein [Chitinophagaceae bacterium]
MKYLFLSIFTIACLCHPANGQNQPGTLLPGQKEKLLYPSLVNRFYLLKNNKPCWMGAGNESFLLRQQLIIAVDSAYYWGFAENKYHTEELSYYVNNNISDTVLLRQADRLFTDAAIALCKDLYHGYKMHPWVGYDQLSGKYEDGNNEYLLRRLLTVSTAEQFQLLIAALEPAQKEYLLLKNALREHKEKEHKDTVTMIRLSMNYFRWIHHFSFEQLIVINLPEARMRYYEKDSIIFNMKVVVGKTSTPTPRFATVCDQVILYPYWYVPRSITFNEYLPKIKRNPSWIDANNMQVIDGSGKVMDHLNMDWSSFHSGYFPYIIRQSTGCDNALGVIKFNIVTPYGVYMHDTNNKTVFLSGLRYFSHGCIRLEEPLELGNRLLAGRLDTAYLQSCFKEQKPKFMQLEKTIPVFSVYMPAAATAEGTIRYYKDIYKLLR